MEELLLIDELRKCLMPERYFVVFDDVWEVNFWEDVQHALLENCSGSRILITTRNEDVANFCKRSSMIHVHQMKPLPRQQAWELFCQKAFKFEFDGRCPNDLEEVSLAIVERCGGLPLAIVAIGGLLATKQKVAIEWKRFLDSLGSALMSNPHLENVIKILSLSYDDLPYHLKSCFLYFGMFPEDFSIGHGKLMRLWVAEVFVLEKQGLTSEEVAEEYLAELIRRNLVQVHGVGVKGIPKTCCVHDLVRDVILSKSEELSFCHFSSNSLKVEGIARHLSICNGKGDNPKSSTKSQTRSVMVFTEAELPKPMISSVFAKCKLLTALDFEKCPVDHIPKQFGKLLHLKYLNLRHTLVSKLPKSIGKLHNLESLDLRDSSVVGLPVKIDKFPKLRHLLGFSKKRVGVRIHGTIGHLEFLQTLFTIRADVRLINELGMLKHLRKLGIILSKTEYGRVLCTAIENMTCLRSLYVSSANYGDEILEVESISSPPVQLQTLRLWGVLERLPDWISKLDSLTQLILGNSCLIDDPIKVLQALPNLRSLALVHVYNGDKIHFEGGGFQKLKKLLLTDLGSLNMMIIDQGALPLLKVLVMGGSPQLKEVPSGIQHLTGLFRLSFYRMSNEFNQRLSSNGGEDYWIVKNVPLFVYDDTYDPNDKAWTLQLYVHKYKDL